MLAAFPCSRCVADEESQLLESISSKRPTFLSQPQWQIFRNFRPRFLPWYPDTPGKNAATSAAIAASPQGPSVVTGPMHYHDFVLDHLIIIANLTAEFADQMQRRKGIAAEGSGRSSDDSPLERIQGQGLVTLERLETVVAHMMADIGGPFKVATSQSPARGTGTGPLWGKPLEYNLSSMCRTAAITLRLLMCDLITERKQQRQGTGGGETDSLDAELAQHRTALMAHVEAIVGLIPYSSTHDIFGVAPVCFVMTFRLATVVLAREVEALRGEGVHAGGDAARCAMMDKLIRSHLDFVASRKITIRVDI